MLAGPGASGATSLALAIAAAVSRQGGWVATVGLPGLGAEAAAELGVALERFPQVAVSRGSGDAAVWATVVATLRQISEAPEEPGA